MKYTYKTNGTCSRAITFDIEQDNTVKNVKFEGGCNGNLQGISKMAEGMKADSLIELLKGIKCGFKSTSCPDQLAKALEQAKKRE
ncbi:MAG: TIGR03905 family TSCPD domain-containing protein [Bacillota bacterium]|nr:TIGR03905 family TSCPD domain-containing protein [Bacillota bacterium]